MNVFGLGVSALLLGDSARFPEGASCVSLPYRTANTSINAPGTSIARRQLWALVQPSAKSAVTSNGITTWATPPPRLPQPAAVAFAVPTTFGANMTDVWYCV